MKSFFSLFSHQCKIKSLFVKRFILNNKGWTKFRYRNDLFRKLKEKPVNERQKPLIFKSLYRLYVSKLCIYLYSVFTCNLYLLVLYLYSEFTCTLYVYACTIPVLGIYLYSNLYSVFTCTLYLPVLYLYSVYICTITYTLYLHVLCIYLYYTCRLYSEFTCTLYMPVLYLYSVFTCTLYILSSCFIYALLNLVHTIPVLCIYL